jgi:hypothetical protein
MLQMNIEKEVMVVIPLRVSRDQRRIWRVEAGKEDKSVQRWILDKIVGKPGKQEETRGKLEGN